MTQQERELLQGLVERVNGTQLTSKDADAEQLLSGALRSNPDALYILCQTVLVQQFAMDNAQRQLTEARAEVERLQKAAKPEEHGSFLGNLFGLGKGDSAGQQGGSTPSPSAGGAGYAPVHNPGTPPQPVPPGYGGYGGPGYAPSPYSYGGGMPMGGGGLFGGGGGFLQGAMQTAAGVVAGEFAFRALEDVFQGFGGGHEGRGFAGTDTGSNDFRDDAGSGGFGDRLEAADGYSGSISPDIEDRRSEASGFFGGSDDNSGDGFADNGSDDFAASDSSGFDDSSYSGGDDGNGF